ncbi:MAG: DUF3784 domain-containing protein [Methanomassiliicoccaceae archaeon]|nr:DUF3784 domain-containing protein [Methanomassiliicoccaceae archaeon]
MGLLWAAVIAAVMLCIPEDDWGMMVWLWPLFSSIVMVCGIGVYLGGYMLLAGFNTMSKDERSAFDMEKVTSFTGASLVLLSYVFFLSWPSSVFYGPMMFWVMTVAFVAGVVFMAVFLNTGRFKVDPPKRS